MITVLTPIWDYWGGILTTFNIAAQHIAGDRSGCIFLRGFLVKVAHKLGDRFLSKHIFKTFSNTLVLFKLFQKSYKQLRGQDQKYL